MADQPQTLADLFGIPVPDRYECQAEGPYKGKKYPARQPNQIEQGMFCRWLEAEATAFVERQTHLPAEAVRAYRKGVRDDGAAGTFDFYGEVSLARQHTLGGAAKLLSICLIADGHGEADHEFCKQMMLAEATRTAAEMVRLAEAGDPKAKSALDMFRALMTSPTGSLASKRTTSKGSSGPRSTGRKRKSRK